MSRIIIIIAVIFAVVLVVNAIIGVITGQEWLYAVAPVFLICILPAAISQQKFEKWLEAEKNIITKKKK